MNRNVLLIEPNYKNKYPPLGLMKLATYHRLLNDHVTFYKGDLKTFILNDTYKKALKKCKEIEKGIVWEKRKTTIIQYIKTKKRKILEELLKDAAPNEVFLVEWLNYYSDHYRLGSYKKKPEWDRVCITTLFTFHWKITIDTIKFCKFLVKDLHELKVGGILATVLHDEIKKQTGITPYKGLLDQPGILDNNDIIIDNLSLDYSILDEIDYKYPESNAYFGYMTRGCVRKCDFCSVWKIEPKYKSFIPIKDNIEKTKKEYGDQRNLLLLDNNVLASKHFPEIIKEIKQIGFIKGSKFTEPNYLAIAINNLKKGKNNNAFVKKSYHLLNALLEKLKGEHRQNLYNLLEAHNLLSLDTTTKENLLKIYSKVSELYEKHRNRTPKQRYVDFNQGIDARFMTEEKMKLLSEIPIKPLRIAFDSLEFKKEYVNAIKWAEKYRIKNLSNYLLYNYEEKPVDLYRRLEINIKLCQEFDVIIYSFPMKYLPIDMDGYYMNRDYVGKYWNKKFLRAVQVILNSTKGKVSRSPSFFMKAFGKNEQEYFELLYMPASYLLFRYFFEYLGNVDEWRYAFSDKNLGKNEKEIAKKIIEANDFSNINSLTSNTKILKLMQHYTNFTASSLEDPDSELYRLKKKFNHSGKKEKAIKKFKNLVGDKF
jgi:hypothetical protein